MERDEDGYHQGFDKEGRAGDQYQYSFLEGDVCPAPKGSKPDCHSGVPQRSSDNSPRQAAAASSQVALSLESFYSDPVSRAQARDVHGPSIVVDAKSYSWSDQLWKRPRFRDLVIYELHVGTFTQEGTFSAVGTMLPLLQDLGINAIELMPVADFPGQRNWGYDGVLPYAPARVYGTPDDLRGLVDAAHSHGIAVILDVVYNHFGPDGNYLAKFSREYFHPTSQTPWGSAFNFDGPHSDSVREYFIGNTLYWMEEFHIDGFRFDAAHEIRDDSRRHILSEMADLIHERGGYAMAEDARNECTTLTEGEGWGLDGTWADDFHHSVRVSQTREEAGYYQNFDGSMREIVDTLQHGWHYRGQPTRGSGTPRGTPCRQLPPQKFIHCISNHDQTGNRAHGERLHQSISPAAYRALSALLCLSPYTPLLFMGQEWAATAPFLFFTDHNEELGKLITEGRRNEFSAFPEFTQLSNPASIPDPQAIETFQQSILNWDEREVGSHGQVLDLYSEALRFRQQLPEMRPSGREGWSVRLLPWGVGLLGFASQASRSAVVFDLIGGHLGPLPYDGEWTMLLSTESRRFGGRDEASWDPIRRMALFESPAVLLLQQHR
jgi:maltooligosyltrehalose trehalohydrolase